MRTQIVSLSMTGTSIRAAPARSGNENVPAAVAPARAAEPLTKSRRLIVASLARPVLLIRILAASRMGPQALATSARRSPPLQEVCVHSRYDHGEAGAMKPRAGGSKTPPKYSSRGQVWVRVTSAHHAGALGRSRVRRIAPEVVALPKSRARATF